MNEEMLSQPDDQLMSILKKALVELEDRGKIVLCTGTPDTPAKFLHDELKELMPSEVLCPAELSGLRSLTLHAINDKRFFDWEMPSLTGFNAEEFAEIAEKLPKG